MKQKSVIFVEYTEIQRHNIFHFVILLVLFFLISFVNYLYFVMFSFGYYVQTDHTSLTANKGEYLMDLEQT